MLRSISLAQRIGVSHSKAFQALYLPGGKPPQADQPFRNPALARTLVALARDGGQIFIEALEPGLVAATSQVLQDQADRLKG
ncbi:hypothetical protein [Synechococcus sp. MIT S9504]|uniref:hypothetical protein n=1 Tax=Synechococcus sp. MIT S9504 TaxID=1801628 RepID=UPI0035128E16